MTVGWTAPATHDTKDVIAVVSGGVVSASAEVPAGASGEVKITVPAGRYRVQYRLGGVDGQVAADTIHDSTVEEPMPPPGDNPPPPVPEWDLTDKRLRKITLYQNGVKFSEIETTDYTEAIRHLQNFAYGEAKGNYKVEVRYANVTYPDAPDEVGTWEKK